MTRLWIRSRWMRRWLRTGMTLTLVFVTAIASTALASQAWAPEDPWRLVAEVPIVRGPEARDVQVVARFLDDHRVMLDSKELLTIAESVTEQSRRHGLDLELLLSVIMSESRFRADAVSEKGAIGLMQLLPSTAAEVAHDLDLEWGGDVRLLDPKTNIALGSYYLRYLMDVFDDDLDLALTAYNRGMGKVRQQMTDAAADGSHTGLSSSYARQIVARANVRSRAL